MIMRKLGWLAPDGDRYPLRFADRQGVVHNVLEVGPKLMKSHLKRDWHALIAKAAAGPLGLLPEDRLFYHTKALLSDLSTLTAQEKAVLGNFLVGGTWTAERLEKAGYLVDPADRTCQLCHAADDTIHHRLFDCCAPEVLQLRRDLVPSRLASWLHGHSSALCHRIRPHLALREDGARRLALRGLARHPGLGQPLPAAEGSSYEGLTHEALASGRAFIDGACTTPFHPDLARASWSAGSVTPEGELIGFAYGPVWRSMPQSAPCSEAVAFNALVQLTPLNAQGIVTISDNEGVVKQVNDPTPARQLHRLFSPACGAVR